MDKWRIIRIALKVLPFVIAIVVLLSQIETIVPLRPIDNPGGG